MSERDRLMFYRYRYALIDNKEALVKFLLAVDWSKEVEENEAMKLLN